MRDNKKTIRFAAFACLAWLYCGCAAQPASAPAGANAEPAESKGSNITYTGNATADLDAAIRMVAELKYSEAVMKLSTVLPVLEHSGDAKYAAECAFWMGFCEEKLGHNQLASNHYKKVLQQYSRQPVAELAKQRLAALPSADSKPKSAE